MQDSKREELKKMVNEYQGNCYWEAEGWGDNVPSEEDLEKELESLLDYFDSEISKAREEGKLEVLEELLEWDTPLEPTGKFMRLQTKMVHMKKDLISKLTTK